jgi:AraC family transcriptional regulator, alkane utilization regulator
MCRDTTGVDQESMDALSDVLKSLRLEGAVYLNAEFTAPWCVKSEHGLERIRARLADAEHVLFFHFFVEGGCKVPRASGEPPIEVSAGDVLLFPQGDRMLIGSDLHLAPVDAGGLGEPAGGADDIIQIRHGGGGALTRVVCGFLAASRGVSRLLFEGLPRVLRIPVGDEREATILHELLCFGMRESLSARPGAASLLAKLAELVFVEALRRYVENMPPEGRGWLAGLRDVHVGRALALIHRDPGQPWTVDELAREAALSRSALAERFASLVGEPPIQYLMRWRLALAAQALRAQSEVISRIAERSGYESSAAFSRAFRREFGMSPAEWRRAARTS